MSMKTLDDVELTGKRVFLRVDYNVPLDKQRQVKDDLRIRATLPSIRKILEAGGTVALPKMALTGMAWQGYYLDTEGNTIGIHQPDPEAR